MLSVASAGMTVTCALGSTGGHGAGAATSAARRATRMTTTTSDVGADVEVRDQDSLPGRRELGHP
jgi:hypothetical protein